MAPTARALSPEVAALARDFSRTAQGMAMPAARLTHWRDTLGALPTSRRGGVIDELTALSVKLKRLGAAKSEGARAQLAALSAVLLTQGSRLKKASGWKSAPAAAKKPSTRR